MERAAEDEADCVCSSSYPPEDLGRAERDRADLGQPVDEVRELRAGLDRASEEGCSLFDPAGAQEQHSLPGRRLGVVAERHQRGGETVECPLEVVTSDRLRAGDQAGGNTDSKKMS